MSDKKKKTKKKFSLLKFLWYVIWSGVLILILIRVVIPRGMNLWRQYSIKKDMESVYTDADFVKVKCDIKPVDRAELEGQFLWYGGGLPEDDLYCFLIYDSEDNVGTGYATKGGTVVFDSYAARYYADEMVASFNEVVDFEHNFPGLYYYIEKINIINECRLVLTHDCTTYEGFLTAGNIGYFFFLSEGYPGLMVGLGDSDKETIEAINAILADADFGIYIYYSSMKGEVPDDSVAYLYFEDFCGAYHPFDAPYNEAILGE